MSASDGSGLRAAAAHRFLSPHYDDMHEMYVKGEYITADKDPERIKKNARYHMVLKPLQ